MVNSGYTTQYFHLERGAQQGDPFSAYIFIHTLEVLSFWLETIKALEVSIFFIILLYTQLMQMIQRLVIINKIINKINKKRYTL